MTMKKAYLRYQQEHLSLRDELAIDRTILANERTLLGYVRTALGFLVLGLTFLHFLQQIYYHVTGYAFMAVAAIVAVVGVVRFLQMRKELDTLRASAGRNDDSEPTEGRLA